MSHARGTKCSHYFFTYEAGKHKMDAMVHGFVGDSSATSYSELMIAGSHHHLEFFQALARYQGNACSMPYKSPMQWFPKLKMRNLNELLTDVKSEWPMKPLAKKIRSTLTAEQLARLPQQFSTVCIPLTHACLVLVDSRVVRCASTDVSNTARWKVLFKCLGKNEEQQFDKLDLYSCFPRPGYARKYERLHYERDHSQPSSPWPYRLPANQTYNKDLQAALKDRMSKYGFVMIPLSSDHVHHYMENMAQYMKSLMAWPEHLSPLSLEVLKTSDTLNHRHLYRNITQKQSKHIPMIHGRTRYGHYCPALRNLFSDIESIVAHAYSVMYPEDHQIWATTAEIIVQF